MIQFRTNIPEIVATFREELDSIPKERLIEEAPKLVARYHHILLHDEGGPDTQYVKGILKEMFLGGTCYGLGKVLCEIHIPAAFPIAQDLALICGNFEDTFPEDVSESMERNFINALLKDEVYTLETLPQRFSAIVSPELDEFLNR
ncbi:hypothetical protein HYV12_00050 [Candidatus Dojkabacteria bacterium]|nr:hypothetical protein [Candidatus Dojkabacteria bacterium]